MRWVLLALALLIAGCETEGPVAVRSNPSRVERMPVGGLRTLATSATCLYWIESRDGSVYRTSMDGTVKELVVDCRSLNRRSRRPTVRVSGDSHRGSSLTVGNTPRGNGYIVIDANPRVEVNRDLTNFVEGLYRNETAIGAPYFVGSKASAWRVDLSAGSIEGLDHYHPVLSEVVFRAPDGSSARYVFGSDDASILALLPEDAIVLQDGTRVVLWTLNDDRKYLLAEGWHATVWPRDLRNPQRFKPGASTLVSGVRYRYTMAGPSDLYREPGQMTAIRSRRGDANGRWTP